MPRQPCHFLSGRKQDCKKMGVKNHNIKTPLNHIGSEALFL